MLLSLLYLLTRDLKMVLLLLLRLGRLLLRMHLLHRSTHELHVITILWRVDHRLLFHHLGQEGVLGFLLGGGVRRRGLLLLLLLLVLDTAVIEGIHSGVGAAVDASVGCVEALGLRDVVALED